MTEEKDIPKKTSANEPAVMPAAIVTFEENYTPKDSQRNKKNI